MWMRVLPQWLHQLAVEVEVVGGGSYVARPWKQHQRREVLQDMMTRIKRTVAWERLQWGEVRALCVV
jgi:hypothetical protein